MRTSKIGSATRASLIVLMASGVVVGGLACGKSGAPAPGGVFIPDEDAQRPDTFRPPSETGAPPDGATPDVADAGETTITPPSDAIGIPDFGEVSLPPADALTMDSSVGPAVCNPLTPWGAAPNAAIDGVSSASDDLLGSITPDELTIAWMTGTTVHWADRTGVSDPFGTKGTVPAASDFYGIDRVALSPDGLRLIVSRSDGRGFAELTRGSRTASFSGTPSNVFLTAVNGSISPVEKLADPVVSADDKHLYYSKYGGTETITIMVATKSSGGAWVPSGSIKGAKLESVSGKRRMPTGISADDRTLFFFDQSTGKAGMAHRVDFGSEFTTFKEVGDRRSLQPNKSCFKLYLSAPVSDAGPGLDLFTLVSG